MYYQGNSIPQFVILPHKYSLPLAQLTQEGLGQNGKRNFKACVKAFCGGKKKGTTGMPPGQTRHALV